MEQKMQSPKFLRQRNFFIVLPLLVLPFITLMFWAMGGGKVSNAGAQQAQQGFNMNLPDAYLKEDKPLDKMSYYEQAARDSAKMKELMKNDPYYNNQTSSNTDEGNVYDNSVSLPQYGNNSNSGGLKTSPYSGGAYNDPNEAKVYQKLEQLNKVLNNTNATEIKSEDHSTISRSGNASINTEDVDRLEQMMQTMSQPDGEDPEMQQLNGMLEKILDIQHPDRVQERLRQTSEARKGEVFAVSAPGNKTTVSLLDNSHLAETGYNSNIPILNQSNAFYSLNDIAALNNLQNAIEAVIHETQTVVNGSTVKLRLVNDIYINGVLIPKDNFLFGTASLNGERLSIKINSIRFQNSLFPVELSVYDMDGMDGIYIPGAITRDVAKQSADRAFQGFGMTTLDPSLGAQVASAGIETARSLLSKKVKLIKVTIKAGYQVLLRDEKQLN
ncbi:conjugative transposon protein TraM [Pontibacter sp. 172403-2]|uniref:conjugative transposon protein TraM n=1 Tax=Pontibacter rufus TaxID=2791028 RepID=UPI0018AFA9FB|nr:conjugative transposon protein TraM [Pontibacter sp. 172403-2]MBF9252128.1 conjugative transposon protein TraM [Pontibacter sp. 172403-2]